MDMFPGILISSSRESLSESLHGSRRGARVGLFASEFVLWSSLIYCLYPTHHLSILAAQWRNGIVLKQVPTVVERCLRQTYAL